MTERSQATIDSITDATPHIIDVEETVRLADLERKRLRKIGQEITESLTQSDFHDIRDARPNVSDKLL